MPLRFFPLLVQQIACLPLQVFLSHSIIADPSHCGFFENNLRIWFSQLLFIVETCTLPLYDHQNDL